MVQSIDRAMQIINILVSDDSKNDWSISDLTEVTSLPLSTLHRILTSLIQHGLVSQIPETKRYRAGYKWMEIGLRLLDKLDFRIVARPVMMRLAEEVEESAFLSVPSGTDGIVIEKIDGPLKLRIAESLGDRIPLHIGAPNRTILANMKDQQVEEILNLLLAPEEKHTFKEQLSEVRRKGYAISYSEKTEGTASIAAAVIGYQNNLVASLSIGGPSFRFADDRLIELTEKVKAAAEEISIKIGKVPVRY